MGQESSRIFCYGISEEDEDLRLDVFLSSRPISLSRARIQSLIKDGYVRVNSHPAKPSYKLKAGDRIHLSIPPVAVLALEPEPVAFGVVYEDESLIVVDKPAGLVVHPAPGHSTGTLVHGLLMHCRDLSGVGGLLRPGIVHRLDKDTSGLMVAAKSQVAHESLAEQFKSGRVKKEYVAIVHGRVRGEKGKIDLPIARHPRRRKEMSVALSGGRRALTLWEKVDEFQTGFSFLSLSLKTGRTHQIRVHLSHMGHPVAGDATYGYGRNWWRLHPLHQKGLLPVVQRQMLHSRRLGFFHPTRRQYVEFESPPAEDMAAILHVLRSLDSKDKADKPLDTGKNAAIYK